MQPRPASPPRLVQVVPVGEVQVVPLEEGNDQHDSHDQDMVLSTSSQTPMPAGGQQKEDPMVQTASKIRGSFTSPSCVVMAAGTVLAFCAGMVNSVCALQLGAFVSHVTGSVAKIGVRAEGLHVGRDTPEEFREACLLVTFFIFGALLCGVLIAKNEVHFGKSLYGVALMGNAALLVTAAFLDHHEAALYFAAAACGLQNGMCTMHFGAVVRTTHVTGLATDLGTALGRLLAIFVRRGCRRSTFSALDAAEVEVDLKRIRVFCLLLSGFFLGVLSGAYTQQFLGVRALLLPASVTGVCGLSYTLFGARMKKRVKAMEVVRLEEDVEEVEAILERTKSYLNDTRKRLMSQKSGLSAQRDTRDLEAAIDIDERMGHMIEVMHSVEEALKQIYGAPKKDQPGN
eukprot:TRINITY_DN3022_c0_g2_i1.p1 TRINITY_DN3022_c0_g2~~TRINITY_DN3022_c0_g2_i1.p1  ORF type:complete len:400 (+),score=78.05 TRINITY_DN3022_c0_g2_i1:86-1285(+)